MPAELGAARTQLISMGELAPGAVAAIRNEVIQSLLDQASRELRIGKERLVVRDIRPTGDLDYSGENWHEITGSTTGAYETMSTGTMASDRYVALFGVQDQSPNALAVSQLKFNVGGGDRAIWGLQNLNDSDGRVGFSPSAVIIPQNVPYTISRYVVQASVAAHIVLKGVVVEPRGKVVSP